MREHGILFKGEMVRPILRGTKTMTRRLVKPQPDDVSVCGKPVRFVTQKFLEDGQVVERERDAQGNRYVKILTCPYGEAGDRLWVRETWIQKGQWRMPEWPEADADDAYWDGSREIGFAADLAPEPGGVEHNLVPPRWRKRPSIHMPRWASRILLEITSTRVERLQEITEVDAIAEGALSVRSDAWDRKHFPTYVSERDHARATGTKPPLGPSPRRTFQALWESINGIDSWNANPWVWVVEFRRVEASA